MFPGPEHPTSFVLCIIFDIGHATVDDQAVDFLV